MVEGASMVCSIGSGRMAAMARILASGSFSQSIPEVGHQKLTSQKINREIYEGNEANLLDEEDMHVYGLMPMEDPLHLVCCNACRKPVKASQYTAHAELCKLLSFKETILDTNDGAGHKRPPRKDRKKLLKINAYQSTISREQLRSGYIEVDDAAPESHLNEQMAVTPFITEESKGRDVLKGSSGGIAEPHNHVAGHHNPVCALECCRSTNVIPAPLATKIYYSQSNHRLRSALSDMYHGSYTKEYYYDHPVTQNMSQEKLISPKIFVHEHINDQAEIKMYSHDVPSASSPDQSQNLEAILNKEFATQIPVDNTIQPHIAPVRMARSKYSFPISSETPIGTMEQRNGRASPLNQA